MLYEPKNLRKWTLPDNYIGELWSNHYSAGVGQSRDSSCLEQSNFSVMLAHLGGESELITIVRESHWAVGWIEWIAIEADGSAESNAALAIADELSEQLKNYPILDENDFFEREQEEANSIWKSCYNVSERIAYIRENRYQFDFSDLADMLNCVRGEYFIGYANELI